MIKKMIKPIITFLTILTLNSCSPKFRIPKSEYTNTNQKNNQFSSRFIYEGEKISILEIQTQVLNSSNGMNQSRVHHTERTLYLIKNRDSSDYIKYPVNLRTQIQTNTYNYDFAGLAEAIKDRPDLLAKLKKIKRKELYRKPSRLILSAGIGVSTPLFVIGGATSLITHNKKNIPFIIGTGVVSGLSIYLDVKGYRKRNRELFSIIQEYNKTSN
jgi:hypothetical protein